MRVEYSSPENDISVGMAQLSNIFWSGGSKFHRLVEWVNPGMAAVYKRRFTDSLPGNRLGSIAVRAVANRCQYRNLSSEICGKWLRRLCLLDTDGRVRLIMHTPMVGTLNLRAEPFARFLHLCSDMSLVQTISSTQPYCDIQSSVTTDNTIMHYLNAETYNSAITVTTMDCARLLLNSLAEMISMVCDSVMHLAIEHSDKRLLQQIARINSHCKIGASYGRMLNIEELNSIGFCLKYPDTGAKEPNGTGCGQKSELYSCC